MIEVPGADSNLSPEKYNQYKKEFEKSANLFDEALTNYQKADEFQKKKEYQKVMNECLNVMNQTVKAALKEEDRKLEKKLKTDFQTFEKKEDPKTVEELKKDIDNIKKSL